MAPKTYGQTIAVVDRSGKVISTSKTLLSILQSARTAYQDKKAEIRSSDSPQIPTRKRHNHTSRNGPHRLKSSPAEYSRSPTFSPSSSRHRDGRNLSEHHRRSQHHRAGSHSPPLPTPSGLGRTHEAPSLILEDGFDLSRAQQQQSQLSRRHTDQNGGHRSNHSSRVPSRNSSEIDLALAYGGPQPSPGLAENDELTPLFQRCSNLLTEFHCVSHSVTATIALLQRDPDALAAVALTLAEISNVASKMAPGALVAMKSSFPAVVALVCSPQFLIAAGVGAGVLVVGLGGYKIIKKIQENKRKDGEKEEMIELEADVSRIDVWRRGVTEIGDVEEAGSMAETSVEGEFITPEAAAMKMGLGLEGKEDWKKERRAKAKRDKEKEKSARKDGKKAEELQKKMSKETTKAKKSVKAGSTLQSIFRTDKQRQLGDTRFV